MKKALRFNKILRAIIVSICIFVLCKKTISATLLNPSQQVYITSITYSWDSIGSNNYSFELSTDSFSSYISSGTTTTSSLTFISLKGNTSYYFRVKISTEDYEPSNILSTVTLTAPISNLSVIKNIYINSVYSKIHLSFDPLNAEDTLYRIDLSTDSNFQPDLTTSSLITGKPPFEVENLLTNTTYYFKLKPFDRQARPTDFSNPISTVTVAKLPDSFNIDVFITSISINWTSVNGSNEYGSSGYNIALNDSNGNNIQNIDIPDPNTTSYAVINLSTNTKYIINFSVINSIGVKNTLSIFINTLSPPPSGFEIIGITSVSASFSWNEITPHSDFDGYVVEASTSPTFDRPISSSTKIKSLTTLSLSSLLPNTTYYFRLASLNNQQTPNYSPYIATMTYSMPMDLTTISYTPLPFSIKADYEKRLPPTDPYGTYGYIFEISTSPFDGGVVYSSYTDSNEINSLTVWGLKPNVVYYARIGTFNGRGAISYSKISSLKTPFPDIDLNPYIISHSSTSITIGYSTGNTDGYEAQISTDESFLYIFASTSTPDKNQSSLTLTNLNTNTLYYIKVGAIFSGSTKYFYIDKPVRTLTEPPSPQDFKIYITSALAQWTSIPNSSGYYFEASTSATFTPKKFSYTLSPTITKLDLIDLTPNTSYYFRVGSINSLGEANYTFITQTSTLANFPIREELSHLTTYSMQINFQANSNPPDTLYLVEISSKDFTEPSLILSSYTYNTYAYFEGLKPNTTYYQRVTAFNRNSIPTGPVIFKPIATLAYKVSNLTHITSTRSIVLSWEDNDNAQGTLYLAEISSDGFRTEFSSYTLSKSATFYNLNGNTIYNIRVSALNFSFLPSEYEVLITTTRVERPATKNPTYLNILLDGFTLQWDNNSNSTNTLYTVEVSTNQTFSPLFRTVQTTSTYLVFGNLNFGTNYYVRLKAKGINNEESEYLDLSSVETLYRAEKSIDHTKNNSLSIPFSYGSIEVIIPAYSLGSPTKLFIEPLTSLPPLLSNAAEIETTNPPYAARIYIIPKILFTGPITVKIPYKTLDPSIDPSRLIIARYDEDKGLWIPLKSSRSSNYIIAETYGFSIFAIAELKAAQSIDNVKIYPNPYKPNTTAGYLNFSNLEPGAEIYIHSLNGEMIKKLVASNSGMVQWDAKNSDGKEIASGVYIAIIKSKSGKKIIKKIGIEK